MRTEPLRNFIRACQDELVDWLQRELHSSEQPPPMDRVISLTLACRTIGMVPLVERLLGQAGPEAGRALLRALVLLNDARALSVLNDLLVTGDKATRGDILYLLGGSTHPLAEEALLSVAVRRHWLGGSLEERLAALSSLSRVGTARSQEVLRGLAGSWLLRLTTNGRRVRELARRTLAAVEARVTAATPEEGERATRPGDSGAPEGNREG